MTAWTLLGALVFVSAVIVAILSVVRLDDRFRDEQHGFPTKGNDPDPGPGRLSPH